VIKYVIPWSGFVVSPWAHSGGTTRSTNVSNDESVAKGFLFKVYMLTFAKVRELFDYVEGRLVYKVCAKKHGNVGKDAGFQRPDGYWKISIDGKQYYKHRVIFLWYYGFLPKIIDHADGNVANNTIQNLRAATQAQNNCNRKLSRNKSGFYGVSLHKPSGLYRARIKVQSSTINLGYYKTPQEASQAYEIASEKYHGQFRAKNRLVLLKGVNEEV